MVESEEKLRAACEGREEDDDDEDEESSWDSDSEIGAALVWLDLNDSSEALVGAFIPSARRPIAHGGLQSRPNTSILQPLSNGNQKFTNHIRVERRLNVGMSSSVTASIGESVRNMATGKIRTHDKADPAMVELANVYHATRSDGQELAVKIYITSVLIFKLKSAGIRCPSPIQLRLHVLVMEFIGKAGWAAHGLKDSDLSLDKLFEGYLEFVPSIFIRTRLSPYGVSYQ
ncbi:hypothetical protein SAY86_007372 [Trapa natans]|uniref:non-specific serine/threonine protein kinase n=1 Tax=Trapa natans TaxID=22666 RepID=A0AAN7L863_TRANT|nr:hypothetical protein SAY86_007372 [Trapa natans]